MKKIVFLLILPILIFGKVSTDNQAQGLLEIFINTKDAWILAVIPFALRLFWLLVIIDWVWTFGMILLKGTEISEILTTLIQKVIIIGFFLALFQHTAWLDTIPDSFGNLADTINALPKKIKPDTVLEQGFLIVAKVWEGTSWFSSPGDSIGLMFAGLIILGAFVVMTAIFFTVTVKLYLLIVGAYFIFALGGHSHTRSMATNAITAVFKAGFELFFIKLLLGFSLNTITTMTANVGTDNNSIMAMIAVSVLIAALVGMVSGLTESLASGTLGTNGSLPTMAKNAVMKSASAGANAVGGVVGGALGGAVGGAVGGAAASVAQVQSANASSGSDSGVSNNSDSGNFKKTATSSSSSQNSNSSSSGSFVKTATAGVVGAGAGAITGAVAGALGSKTNSASKSTGKAIGKIFSSNNSEKEESSNGEQSNEESSYVSGVPRTNTNK